MAYAKEAAAIDPGFHVFPSTEAALLEARGGAFAGCISATANLNADLCARAFHHGDAAALEAAVTIRKLFEGKPLVPGIKSLLGHIPGIAPVSRTLSTAKSRAIAIGALSASPTQRPGKISSALSPNTASISMLRWARFDQQSSVCCGLDHLRSMSIGQAHRSVGS